MKRGSSLKRKSPLKAKTPLRARAPMRKRSRTKSTPMRQAARGKPCLLNVANVCNYNTETTVLAHFRWLANCGTGMKPSDLCAAFSCSACHDWIDGRVDAFDGASYRADRNFYAARALVRMREIDHEGEAA